MIRNLCVALLVLMGVILKGVPGPAGGATGAEAEPLAALVAMVNADRRSVGRAPLVGDRRLACAAEAHARDLAGGARFGHTDSDGGGLADRLARVGYPYRAAAENLAQAGSDAAEVAALWRESPGHARNMLRKEARHAGAARARTRDGRYIWVLVVAEEQPEVPGNPVILSNCGAKSG